MSGRSSEIFDAELQEMIEEYDGDYLRALTDFEGPDEDCGFVWDRKNKVMWKKIPGFGNYEIGSNGTVRSYVHAKPRDLKTWPNQYGHLYTGMTDDNGIKHKMTIHSLVAKAFCHNPNPDEYDVIRHRDDNPWNNDWTNLAYGTQAMNVQDMRDRDRDFKIPVYCYETDTIYKSGAKAAEELGLNKSSISNACKGKTGIVGGYHVCYAEDKERKLSNLDEWLDDSKSYGYRKVKATNLETGDSYIFSSRIEASRALGIPDCGISSVITGHLSQTHGWTFQDLSEEN